MNLRNAALLIVLLALPWALHGQAVPMMNGLDISRLEFSGNYNYFHANAPPGQCGCFGMNGGSGTFLMNITSKWAAMADIAVAKANNVNGTSQNILVINYLFGPRYTYRNHTKWTPYGEILLGGAKEDVNIQFTINRQSFGVLAGGGVTTKLSPKWGLTLGEISYVYTRIPNAVNN